MGTLKEIWDNLVEVRQDSGSNRDQMSRRSRRDRRSRCLLDVTFDRRSGGERRSGLERRKRWRRTGEWGAELDPDRYVKGYHVP